jgi:hypothetical protein
MERRNGRRISSALEESAMSHLVNQGMANDSRRDGRPRVPIFIASPLRVLDKQLNPFVVFP